MGIGADVGANHPVERVGAVVQVQPVGLSIVPGYQVQVAIPIHIPQRDRRCTWASALTSVPITPLKGSVVPLFRYSRLA